MRDSTLSYATDDSSWSRARLRGVRMSASLATVTVIVLVGATGCGKPGYCSDRSNLENSVKDLPNAVKTGGTSGLQSQVATIESDANAVIESAKSDFPTETNTLTTTVAQLKTAVQGLPSNPSASDLAPVALDATAVVNAVKTFTSATKSDCD